MQVKNVGERRGSGEMRREELVGICRLTEWLADTMLNFKAPHSLPVSVHLLSDQMIR